VTQPNNEPSAPEVSEQRYSDLQFVVELHVADLRRCVAVFKESPYATNFARSAAEMEVAANELERALALSRESNEVGDAPAERYRNERNAVPQSEAQHDDEMNQLRKEMELSSMGDRPHNIGAKKLKRLIELETAAQAVKPVATSGDQVVDERRSIRDPNSLDEVEVEDATAGETALTHLLLTPESNMTVCGLAKERILRSVFKARATCPDCKPRSAPIHQVPPAAKSPLGQIKLLHQVLEGTDECVYCQKPQAAWLPMEECPARSGPNPSVKWGESEVTPPAPAEVLTVESALAELREMFPKIGDELIDICKQETFGRLARVHWVVHVYALRFTASTLEEAMQAVREWKDKQNG